MKSRLAPAKEIDRSAATPLAVSRKAEEPDSATQHFPALIAQRKLDDMIAASPRVQQQHALANRMNADPLTASSPASAVVQREMTTYEDIEASAKNKKFSWTKFRTTPKNDNPTKSATARGNGVDTEQGTKLKTKITWLPVDGNTGEAKGVDAQILGPDHMLGSEPQAAKTKVWNKRRVALSKAAGGEKYIAGHLLNNNLGGPGDDARNLTAIPATANTTQSSRIEEPVKNLVNKQYNFVHYKVDIDYEQDTGKGKKWYAAMIKSKWNVLDKDGKDVMPVRTADITIPAPSTLSSEDVDYGDNGEMIDTSNAAKAVVNPETDVVLNNQGYLAVAVTVQKFFKESIKNLKQDLEKAKDTVLESEEEKENFLEDIDQMSEELRETKELLGNIEDELAEKIELLKEAESEKSELRGQIEGIKLELADFKKQTEELRQELESTKRELKVTKKELKSVKRKNSELESRNLHLQIENSILKDDSHLDEANFAHMEDEEGMNLMSKIRFHMERRSVNGFLEESDRKFEQFKLNQQQQQSKKKKNNQNLDDL